MATHIISIMTVLIASFIGAFGAIYLKKGSGKVKKKVTSFIFNVNLIKGVILYGISTVLFIPALKYGELSVLYPLVATTYIWVTVFSKKILKENINTWKWIGILGIFIGVFLIGLGS